jgi:glutamyl-Q tRNA(Asp) synthetase
MEDLDTPRVVPGCADTILRTLEKFGLTWDGEVVWQSRRNELYRAALSELQSKRLTFECSCPRRLRLENEDRGYPGTCRDKPAPTTLVPGATATRFRIDDATLTFECSCPRRLRLENEDRGYPGTCRDKPAPLVPAPGSTATRFRIDDATLTVEDRIQGRCELPLRSLGDVVIRRRDGIFAYQLAVVVDDADQGITDVVRGADLLSSTAWQVCLQRALNVISPTYAHLPVIVEPDGTKLSKSRRSIALDPARVRPLLLCALQLLGQRCDPGLELEAPDSILRRAVENWDPGPLHGMRSRSPLPG